MVSDEDDVPMLDVWDDSGRGVDSEMLKDRRKVPVTIITGFLGAGKVSWMPGRLKAVF